MQTHVSKWWIAGLAVTLWVSAPACNKSDGEEGGEAAAETYDEATAHLVGNWVMNPQYIWVDGMEATSLELSQLRTDYQQNVTMRLELHDDGSAHCEHTGRDTGCTGDGTWEVAGIEERDGNEVAVIHTTMADGQTREYTLLTEAYRMGGLDRVRYHYTDDAGNVSRVEFERR